MKVNYSKSQLISLNAILCVMVLMFVIFPIQLGVLTLAIIPVVAIIISAEILGIWNGMLTGLFFGVLSLVNHLIRPGVLSFAFYNPLVSVFPRILIGVAAYYASKGTARLFPKLPALFRYAAGAFAGVATNTAGVLGFIMLFYYNRPLGSSGSALNVAWLTTLLLTNSILEVAFCVVVTPPIIVAVKKTLALTMIKRGTGDAKPSVVSNNDNMIKKDTD